MDETFFQSALHKPSELRQWLDEQKLVPRKSLSQNFLIDGNIVKKIVHLADVLPNQVIIEIGPGPGVLTQELLALGVKVIAIETDSNFSEKLHRLGKLDVIMADALTLDWPDLLAKIRPTVQATGAPLRLVSNLPYHLSTDLFKLLLPLGHSIDRLVIMVQSEFAQRLQASAKTKHYGPLSILREYCCTIPKTFKVPSSCFFPRPRVESTVLRLDLMERPFQKVKELEKLLTSCFQHRRKTLKGALEAQALSLKAMEALTPYFKKRAEELVLAQWLEILEILSIAR